MSEHDPSTSSGGTAKAVREWFYLWGEDYVAVGYDHECPMTDDEANALEERAAAADELASALEALASMPIKHREDYADDYPVWGVNDWTLTVGAVRQARAALERWREIKEATK